MMRRVQLYAGTVVRHGGAADDNAMVSIKK